VICPDPKRGRMTTGSKASGCDYALVTRPVEAVERAGITNTQVHDEELKPMTDQTKPTNETKPKRLSPGLRKHLRRLKQAARSSGLPYHRPADLPAAK